MDDDWGTPMTLEFAQNSFQILNLRKQFLCDRSRCLKKIVCIIRTQKHGRPPLRSILVPIPTKKMHVWLMYTNVAGIAKCLLQHASFWFPNKHSIVFPGVDIPTLQPKHRERSKKKRYWFVWFFWTSNDQILSVIQSYIRACWKNKTYIHAKNNCRTPDTSWHHQILQAEGRRTKQRQTVEAFTDARADHRSGNLGGVLQ